MKGTFRLLVLVLLVGGWALAALGLHVIVAPPNGGQLPARVVVLPKDRLGFGDTYVDTRPWSLNDVANHPDVVKRLLATGKADVLGHLVKDDPRGMSVESILADAVARGPQQDESPTTAPAPSQAPATQKTMKRDATAPQRASGSATTTKTVHRVNH